MINDTYTADKGASGSLRMVGGKDETMQRMQMATKIYC